MISSVQRYLNCLRILLSSVEGRRILFMKEFTLPPEKAARLSYDWLLNAQRADGGLATWYVDSGWTSSYPETTGYILPTLQRSMQFFGQDRSTEDSIEKAGNWLLSIQCKEGGWPGGYVHQNRPPIVFNTGQVIRGMMSMYAYSKDERYLKAAVKASDWLVALQDDRGFWERSVYLDAVRVYDTYVAAPLARLYTLTGDEKYRRSALRNTHWVSGEKQRENAWFEDADNTIAHNKRPILHTIAYTIDGMIDTGVLLSDESSISSAHKAASRLRDIFLESGKLHGRFDENWSGSEAFITTGGAQMAIIWQKLHKLLPDQSYDQAATKMMGKLLGLQVKNSDWPCQGAIFGSAPVWGRYEAFGCPNWASNTFSTACSFPLMIH